MVPVGARLLCAEPVREGLSGCDPLEAHAGHAVHVGRYDHSVPVDRRRCRQPVGNANGYVIALTPSKKRAGRTTIHCRRHATNARQIDRELGDREINLGAVQNPAVTIGGRSAQG